jgi:sodium transport system permease protein
MRTIGLIFKKEIKNALRDRRTLISVVLVPLVVFPLVGIVPMALIGRQEKKVMEQPSKIAITGAVFTELTDFLKSTGRFVFVDENSPEQALKSGKLDCILKVVKNLSADSTAEVVLCFDVTRSPSRGAADKVRLAVDGFTKKVVASRLEKLGVDPKMLTPVKLQDENVAGEQRMAGFFLGGIIAMMAVIGLISGGMVMAIDATAGEKERKTLEILLASPASRTGIILGKYFGVVLMGMVSVILMTIGFGFSFSLGLRFLPGAGMSLTVNPGVLIYILLTMLVTAGFIGALELAISIFARSYREAQSYLTPLTLVAVVPVIFIQTIGPQPSSGLFYIPLINAMLLIRELLMGVVNSLHITNTLVATLVFALLALRFAFNIFKRESALLR